MSKKIDAMIVGAEKSGTTSFHRYLAGHPDIITHDHLEMAFFVNDSEYNEGYDSAFNRYFGPHGGNGFYLAKNVGCMYFQQAIERMHKHNQKMRLMAMLRNPVDRAYSAYWFARQMGREDKNSFEEAIAAEELRVASGKDCHRRYNAYLMRGLYSEQLRNMYAVFPEEQVHVVLFDEFKGGAEQVVAAAVRFLGLPPMAFASGKKHNKTAGIRSRWIAQSLGGDSLLNGIARAVLPHKIRYRIKSFVRKFNKTEIAIPPMLPSTRERLQQYYREDILQLESMLGRSLGNWLGS